MNKYKHLLFLMLFLFGFQGLADAFQICSETGRDNTPYESQTEVNRMTMDCHQTENDKDNNPEVCDAKHCCISATFSGVYQSEHSMADKNRERINWQSHVYIYSSLNDIYHPPKFLL